MINLMQGDCLERMKEIPDGSVDMVLADPPYGMDFQSQWKKDKDQWKPKISNDKKPFIWWIYEAARALKDGGAMICFCRWDSWAEFAGACEIAGLTVKNQIVWDKLNHGTGDLKGSPGNRHELAIFATKGRFTFSGKRPQTIGAFSRVNPSSLQHPNEKPVELMEWLVKHYAAEGETVLDPFTGVSPVGVACVNTGRKFIGIELDQGYFEIAQERIRMVS